MSNDQTLVRLYKLIFLFLFVFITEMGRSLEFMYAVYAGLEPEGFIELFPYWVVQEDITEIQLDVSRICYISYCCLDLITLILLLLGSECCLFWR